MSHFEVLKITNLSELKVGDTIPESDYVQVKDDKFIQFKYIEQEERIPLKVTPGIYVISTKDMTTTITPTEFSKQSILEEYVATEQIEKEIDQFFSKLEVYRKYRGEETPRRALLLYGSAGMGKSTSISKVCNRYVNQGKTAVVIWPTDKYESYQVKDLVKRFEYEGVDKLLFVIEDIGGVEMEESRRPSDPSLLSLLDNNEKTFTIPTFTLATTNFPEMFMDNIANRPGRLDKKLEVKAPSTEQRVKLFQFFAQNEADDDVLKALSDKKCDKLSPAHLKEIVIRAAIYDKTYKECLKEILEEIKSAEEGFKKRRALGMGFNGE